MPKVTNAFETIRLPCTGPILRSKGWALHLWRIVHFYMTLKARSLHPTAPGPNVAQYGKKETLLKEKCALKLGILNK